MEKKLNITAIIPAAGKPNNTIFRHSNLPDTMLPINGKPVVGYICEDLLSRGIVSSVITLHPDDFHTQKYLEQKYGSLMSLKFVRPSSDRGVGYSIFLAAKVMPKSSGVLIYLGDTIYKGKLPKTQSFLVVSKKYEDPNQWCFAQKRSRGKISFINKPENYHGKGQILCGLYYFNNARLFLKIVDKVEKKRKQIELSDLLDEYQNNDSFKLIQASQWYDCGNVENYYAAKVNFLRVRSFNTLKYDGLFGVLTKSSVKKQKINQEVNWYLNMPHELKIFAPRLFDYSLKGSRPWYSVEYYGYPTLADLYMFAYINPGIWKSIIRKLFETVSLFKKHSASLPFSYFQDMYYSKLYFRLGQLSKKSYWKTIFSLKNITVNGQRLKNISGFEKQVGQMARRLYNRKHMSFIHGDLCLSNILYDAESRLVKLVDPRGSFSKMSVYGDIKYDLAKLRHSFGGFYDFIVSDLFRIQEQSPGHFTYKVFAEKYHQEISRQFDQMLIASHYKLEEIKFIEALLFLSMIPLHDDNHNRQQAMYVTGLKLLNELFI